MFLKLEKDGLLKDDDCTTESALARLDSLQEEYDVESTWRSFREWVQNKEEKKRWLQAKHIKARSAIEHVACSSSSLQELWTIFKSCCFQLRSCPRLTRRSFPLRLAESAAADEKGFSSRADSAFKAVAGRGSHPTGAAPDISWDHVTLLSFLPLCGEPCIGVITPTKRAHPDFQTAFPKSKIWANPSGSATHESFCWMLQEYGKRAREVQKIPASDPVVLIADTGGGALLHLSANIAKVCLSWNIRMFYLPGYTQPVH